MLCSGLHRQFSRPAASAIGRRGFARVVSITALGRGTPWEAHAGSRDEIGCDGRHAEIERCRFCKGIFFGPINPEKKLPFTATRDIAAAAARLLADGMVSMKSLFAGRAICRSTIRARLFLTSGRSIQYQQIGYDDFKQGFHGSVAQGYVDMYRAKNDGMDNVAGRRPENAVRLASANFANA